MPEADLLTRMGGVPALEELVDGLYDNLAADPDLGFFLRKNAAAIDFEHFMKVLKARTVDFCAASFDDSGTHKYNGPDLFNAHAFLSISDKQYDVTMQCTSKKIKKMKMDSKVKKEVLAEFEAMRDPIVDPQGKYRQWLFEKNKELGAADGEERITIMGFSVKASVVRELEEQARKDQERSDKMKERRLLREKEEAEAAKPKPKPKAKKAERLVSAPTPKRASSPKKTGKFVTTESAPAPMARAVSAPSAFKVAMKSALTMETAGRLESASTAGSGPGGASWSSAFTRSSDSTSPVSFRAPDEYRPGDVPSSRPTLLMRS